MAEILGLIAGGAGLASLAIQLGECTLRVKSLYKSYQSAPKFLEDVWDDLDTFALALHNLEKDRQAHKNADRTILDRCVQTCIRAVAQIDAAVARFELAMQRSKIRGRILTALGQSTIIQLCDELERAKSTLIFAYQLYMRSCQNRDTTQILKQLDNNKTILEQITSQVNGHQHTNQQVSSLGKVWNGRPPAHTKAAATFEVVQQRQHTNRQLDRRSKSDRNWRVRFSPWFTSRVWELSFAAAQSGFDFNLRTCNIVPDTALIFEACRGGDIAEVQALFRSGEASPFDCSYGGGLPSGTTVLAAAAASGNVQLCRYLIETAGFPVSPTNSEDPLTAYAHRLLYAKTTSRNAIEMYGVLAKQPSWGIDDLVTGRAECSWWWACPDSSCVRLLRDEFSYDFSKLPWEVQVRLAVDNCRGHSSDEPHRFLSMLGYDSINLRVAKACDNRGRTALHMMGQQIRWIDEAPNPEALAAWADFVQQLLAFGADIHKKCDTGDTPFMYMLRGVASGLYEASARVEAWAQIFQAAGTDLMSYGRRETAVWNALYPSGLKGHSAWIKSWTFGPTFSDWDIICVRIYVIPRYQRLDVPGTLLTDDEFQIRTICWEPMEEDASDGSWHWSEVQGVTIWVDHLPPKIDPFEYTRYYELERELHSTQDDCRTIMRLLQSNSGSCHQRRSCSQPPARTSVYTYRGHCWLPPSHACRADGRHRFSHSEFARGGDRKCAKGMQHNGSWYRHRIRQQMRRFQLRYHNEDELRSLPYAAYHPTWKREWSGVGIEEL